MGGFMIPADPADEARFPAPQLIGAPDNRSLDLQLLQGRGVRLAGKVTGVERHRVRFDNSLATVVRAADEQMQATLAKIDEFAATMGLDDMVGPKEVIPPTRLRDVPAEIDLKGEAITTVLWATGYRRSYPWLKVSVLDERGEIRHRGGVTDEPGLYVLGLRFQRRKNSNLIDGVGNDAAELALHLVERRRRLVA
jgi:putative flavoprotein involved in K+ transport